MLNQLQVFRETKQRCSKSVESRVPDCHIDEYDWTGEAKALAYAGSNGVEVAKQVNGRETKDNDGSSSSETRSMS